MEKVEKPEEGVTYPVCIIGGIWGHGEFLEAIAEPEHPEHEEISEWVDKSYDPEECDLEEINRKLKSLH